MSNDPTDTILDYMKSLRNSMMFGRCAGKTTRLSKLHQNRLIGKVTQGQMNDLETLRKVALGLETFSFPNSIVVPKEPFFEVFDTSEGTNQFCEEIISIWPEDWADCYSEYKLKKGIEIGAKIETLNPYDPIDFNRKWGQELAAYCQEIEKSISTFLDIDKLRTMENDYNRIAERLIRIFGKELMEQLDWTGILDLNPKLKKSTSKSFLKKYFPSMKVTPTGLLHAQIIILTKLDFFASHGEIFPTGISDFIREFKSEKLELFKIVNHFHERQGGLATIFGDPGWGKTIQLRQFTHGFLNDQIQEKNIHRIPIYVKAKTLSKHIRNLASSHYGFAVDLPDGGVVNHGGKTTSHVGETNQILIRSMLETESDLDEEEIRNLFGIQRSVAKNMMLIVDAYDEVPSQDARFELVNFISDEIENHGWPVIMTCRNSHEEELETVFKQMNNDLNPHYKYKIHFTNEELQFVMPTKLANAWGMNSDQISHTVALEFEAFKNVLTHPLFVGLFCMLKSEGAELSVLDIELNSEDRMSIHHVSFLKQVIKFGLRINIKDRKSISDEDEKVIRKAFFYISAVHLTMGINNLDNILTIMEKLHGFKISQTHREILAENLGVMFVNGEKEIEWTHKTLPEVAMGMLMVEDTDFLEFLHSTYRGTFGFNGQLWTECLFLTLIEGDLVSIHKYTTESRGKLSKEYMPKLVEVFWQEGHDIVLKCLKLLGADQQIFDDANYKIDQTTWFENPENLDYPGPVNVNSWEVIPTSGTPFETELRNRIGNSFFYEQISWECPFPLPIESFGSILENNDEDGLLFTFFKTGRVESALIGYQRLDWPKNLARDISLLIESFSITSLANNYFLSLLSVDRFFPQMERRIFARNIRSFWINFCDKLDGQNPWHINISESEFLDLIITCCKNDPDMMLLDSFLSGSKYQTDHEFERLSGIDYYDDITKYVFEKIDRKGSSQGKLEPKWVKDKHRYLFSKLAVLSVEMMLGVHKAKRKNQWEEYMLPLKQHWGIPTDFTLKVTGGSSKFDKIQSLDINKIPDTILRYIVGKIE